jgi:hypothetical protein
VLINPNILAMPLKIIYFLYVFFPLCFIGFKKLGQIPFPPPYPNLSLKMINWAQFEGLDYEIN